jgi:hypothetical protein
MLTISGVYDIETENWDQFVVGEVLLADGRRIVSRSSGDLYRAIRALPGLTLWAHNGGLFDAEWAVDQAVAHGDKVRISCAGARLTRVMIGKPAVELRDSYALVPMRLAAFAQMAGLQKGEPGLPCVCGQACGGYCSIRRDMPESRYRLITDYLHRDCEVVLGALRFLSAYAGEHGIDLRGTVGNSSYQSARADLDLDDADWDSASYRHARAGYYGGRCQVFQPRAVAGHRYDINSAYPAALSKLDLPTGDRYVLGASDASKAWRHGRPGIYRARVTIPDQEIPPLPWRMADGRMAYPVGKLLGSWTAIELDAAVRAGVSIDKLDGAIVWTEQAPTMKPYVDRIWNLRHAAGKASPLGKWLKWLANSLTGKFAQSPDGESIVCNPENDEIIACPGGPCGGRCSDRRCCDHRCVRRCKRWRSIGDSGRVWAVPQWRIAECAHVHWAAYLTAWTRITLRDQLVAGPGSLYCDTDSCYASAPRTDGIGEELGEWADEGAMRDWIALAPKTYRYRDQNDRVVCRAKGLHAITSANFDAFARGEAVIAGSGVLSLRQAAAAGGSLFAKKVLRRSNHADGLWFGDRKLERSGRTRPCTVDELLTRGR